jgi:hypothetical protein
MEYSAHKTMIVYPTFAMKIKFLLYVLRNQLNAPNKFQLQALVKTHLLAPTAFALTIKLVLVVTVILIIKAFATDVNVVIIMEAIMDKTNMDIV